MTPPSFRDVEQLSALLDGQMHPQEAERWRARLDSDPELAALYRQLAQSRALLRKLPARRAPRNFTLTPQMAGVRAPTPRAVPFFRFAAAFASLLLVLTVAVNGLVPLAAAPAPAAAPAYGVGGGPMPEAPEAPAATEPPLRSARVLEEPAPLQEASPASPEDAALPTAETMRSLAALPTETVEEQPHLYAAEEAQPFALAAPAPAPAPWQVPAWLQALLLVVAVVSGLAAWWLGWRAQAEFQRRNRR